MDWGYIKLWRKSKTSAVFAHAGLWKLWSLCLMKAAHEEKGTLHPFCTSPGCCRTAAQNREEDLAAGMDA